MIVFLSLLVFVSIVVYIDFRSNFVNRKELKAYEEAYKIRKKQREISKDLHKLPINDVINSL